MPTPVVSTEGPLDFARGKLRPERRDLLSTIGRLSWREGLSAPRFALRSRRRRLPFPIALPREGRHAPDTVRSLRPGRTGACRRAAGLARRAAARRDGRGAFV